MERETGRRRGRPRLAVDSAKIRLARDEGLSLSKIARIVGCSKRTVLRRLQESAAPSGRTCP